MYTEIQECTHTDLCNGICTNCGLCVETTKLVDSYCENKQYTAVPHMKYAAKNTAKQNMTAIKKILVPCCLSSYANHVNELLLTTKFSGRLKTEDKVILALLHILKEQEFPLAIHDLLKYTSMTKHKLLRIYRNTFEYKNTSCSYFRNIYERTKEWLKTMQHVCTAGCLDEFMKCASELRNSDPKLLCISYLCYVNDLSIKSIILNEEYSQYQMRYTQNKIKNVILQEDRKIK